MQLNSLHSTLDPQPDFSCMSVMYIHYGNCSWGPSKCYIWKCNRDDNSDLCIEKGNDSCSPAIIARLYIIKYSFSSWLCFLHWRDHSFQERSSLQQGSIHLQQAAAVVNSGLLLMAVMGLTFPAVLHFTHSEVQYGKSEVFLSRFSSCVMLVAYASYLVFQLKSCHNLYNPIDEEEGRNKDDSDAVEVPELGQWEAISWLAVLTIWISVLSEYLVNAIEGASTSLNLPMAFISVVLLPIVGNAAEHASAIMFAVKDKLDITLGVAIGSSTQISMFVIPSCVVVGWIMGKHMDLNFQLFETAVLFITVLVVAFMLQDGTANYFKGLMLILCYLIVAASFFVHVDPADGNV
ncbi:vacuolar cation/proton exchanger 3 isoform X2 [Elaeis guineensis]|uniref:vacuolar cation/proton exchanger 3 isoform X2 n=1 Tax=Elaeis guineensis var. tenera TaxID=51953 RepID=UPI003C6D265E